MISAGLALALAALWLSAVGAARAESCGAAIGLEREGRGSIYSPGYPRRYPPRTSCLWRISYPPDATLTLRLLELDIEEDPDCPKPPCCARNWLKYSAARICGRSVDFPDVTFENRPASIKFHSSKALEPGRGFRLSYLVCSKARFRCADNARCVDSAARCDGVPDCDDGSDERNCPESETARVGLPDECSGNDATPCGGGDDKCFNNSTERCDGFVDCPVSGRDEFDCPTCGPKNLYCGSGGCYPSHGPCEDIVHCLEGGGQRGGCNVCTKNHVLCGRRDPCYCFNAETQRCDGQIDCPGGEDETSCVVGCENKIACASVQGCYLPSERCDGVAQCPDRSDEVGCRALPAKYKCVSVPRCVDDFLVCNGEDDCGDGSDEADCVKNSVIIVVIAGSLICGLLAVFGAAVAWRYYSSRSRPNVLGTPNSYRRQEDVEPSDDGSLYRAYREPPPSYQEAIMQGASPPTYCYPARFANASAIADPTTPMTVPRLPRPRCSRTRSRSDRTVPKPRRIAKPPDGSNPSYAIAGDRLYPENASPSALSDGDTPMLELSDNTGTSGTETLTSDSSEMSRSDLTLPEYNSGYRQT